MFSLTANILKGFTNHFLLFLMLSNSCQDFIYFTHLLRPNLVLVYAQSQGTRTFQDANKMHQELPWFKKRLLSLNSILPRKHSILKK